MKSLTDATVQENLLWRISALSQDSPRRWGKMSPHEMICHLNDSFLVAFGEKTVSPATGPMERTLIKWIALYAPMPWPKNVRTRPEIEQSNGGTCPTEFQWDREELVRLLKRFCNGRCEFHGIEHPIFGPMRDSDWLRWGYLHVNHHLRQFGA